jgi:DNA-binding CsgD family transcriptional regulator
MPTFQTVGSSVETSLADLLDGLDQASTPDEVWNVGSKWMMAFGIEWYHYVYTRERWEPGGRQLVRYSSLPQAWMEHYGALGFFRVDPSIRHCLVAVTPMLTGIDAPSRLDGSARRLWEDAQSAGFGGGIITPLRLPGSALGGFSLVTGMAGQEFLAWHKSHGRWATLAAHAIDQRFLTLVEPQSRRPQLSPRERECLAWLAIGLRHDRIAEKLGITRPTVELHLANARRKLNARTREQALARAVAFGLLEL